MVRLSRLDHRKNLVWGAALLHRVSGLAITAFLPLHFLTLSLAVGGEARLDGILRWSRSPLLKFGEAVWAYLPVVHLLGGLRLLAIENFAWQEGQQWRAAMAAACAGVIAIVFFAWLV